MVRFKPQEGFDSEYTQAEANHYPPWHRIRFDPTSTGQQMLNAFAIGVSEANQYLKNARKNLYIETADTLIRTHAYRCPLPQLLKLRKSRGINLLRNASFRKLGQAWRNHPLEWQVTSGEHYPNDGYISHGSIKLYSPAAEFYQIISGEEFRKGQSYVGGIWYKGSNTGEDGLTLSLEAAGWDWSQSVSTSFIANTTGEWVQQSISIVPTGDIRYFTFKVESSFTGEETTKFSAPMFQEGETLNEWEPGNDNTSLFRLYLTGPTGDEQEIIELEEVEGEYEFFEDALPSRIVTSPGITGDLISDNYAPVEYEWTSDFWDCEFRLNGSLIEKYSTQVTGDVWHQYSVLDRYMDNESNTGEYGYVTGEFSGFERTFEALCVWRKRIYLIVKDTYSGETHRVLKIVRWHGIDDRLETIHEVRVGMDTGEVSTIGFIDGRMDQMGIILSDDTEWTMQLYFDIFLFDNDRKQVLVRHPYDNYNLIFSEL